MSGKVGQIQARAVAGGLRDEIGRVAAEKTRLEAAAAAARARAEEADAGRSAAARATDAGSAGGPSAGGPFTPVAAPGSAAERWRERALALRAERVRKARAAAGLEAP